MKGHDTEGAFEIVLDEHWKSLEHKLDKLGHGANDLREVALVSACAVLERGMKRRCKVGRTGATRNSIRTKPDGPGAKRVGPNSPHAGYLEHGTGTHATYPGASGNRIVPIHGKVMRWTNYSGRGMTNSSVIFAQSTAGMEAHPFVRPTYHEDRGAALKAAHAGLKLAIAKKVKT